MKRSTSEPGLTLLLLLFWLWTLTISETFDVGGFGLYGQLYVIYDFRAIICRYYFKARALIGCVVISHK